MSKQNTHTMIYTNLEYNINATVCVSVNEFGTRTVKAAQLNGCKLTPLQALLVDIFAGEISV